MRDASAIILAGGRNSRMNFQNKSFLKLNNETFIERILKEVKNFNQIILCTNNPATYHHLGVECVKDIYENQGPLSGVHSGLISSKFSHSIVLATDMPFLTKDLLEYLIELAHGNDVVVPRSGEFYQPLCAVYSKTCLPYIEANLKQNIMKITEIYKCVKVRYVEEKELRMFGSFETIFRNINTPKEFSDYCTIQRKID